MPTSKQIRHFLVLFFPLLLTQIAQIGTTVFSSIFSGQASTVDLAGVAVGSNIWYPVFAGMCGIFFGISPIISQLRGAQKYDEIPSYIQQSLYVSIFTALVMLALGSGSVSILFCPSWAWNRRSTPLPKNTSLPWP